MFPDRRSPRQMGMNVRPSQQARRGRYPAGRMQEPRRNFGNGGFGLNRPARNPQPQLRPQGGLFKGRSKNKNVPSQEIEKPKTKSSIVQQLKKDDGQWDLDKMMQVSNHLQKMYGQVSPLITRFISK